MIQPGSLSAMAALVVALWSDIVLTAPHGHKPHHHPSRPAIAMRSDSGVTPFQITIKPSQGALHTSAAKARNISAYLLGDAPDPASPAQLRGFIAQHASDGSTSYFMPPAGSPQGVAIATNGSNLSWSVQTLGTTFKTPGTIDSGRIYIVDGYLDFFPSGSGQIVQPDPNNPSDIASRESWGFIELSHGKQNGNEDMTVNLSFVDWVSLPLGMNVTFDDGNGQKTVSIPGLQPDGLAKVCDALSGLDSFWPKLCLRAADNTPLRVMSPQIYNSLNKTDKDVSNYYEPYITQVWNKYKSADLRINTQTSGPNSNTKVDNGAIVTCRVGSDNVLHCDNDAGDFNRPVSGDIWGCDSGPFANPQGTESWSRARVRPRLCAAFVRSTLHLDAIQPSSNVTSSQYYKQPITNHYSRVVHENLIGGMGYAFSYDDVSPSSTENSAGLVSMTNPIQLDIFINN